MFENETDQTILERMKANVDDDIDKRQGSVTHDMLSPAAIELATAYFQLDNVLSFGFATENTPIEYLEKRAAEFGVIRKSSVKATGEVTLSSDNDVFTVDAGSRLATDETNPVYFVTSEEVTVSPNNNATVSITAEKGGERGNVDSGNITLVIGYLSGAVSVTNESPTEGGADQETAESLLSRLQDLVRRPATSGNRYQYEQWAKSRLGVADVRVFPLHAGNGTVKVVLLGEDKTAPPQTVADDVQAYIDPNQNGDGGGVAPIGATVTVTGATEIAITVAADITLAESGNIDEAQTQITENITNHLASIAFADNYVRYSRIANAILDANDVFDYANLTVNGGTSNINVADDEVAVVGTVTVNAI